MMMNVSDDSAIVSEECQLLVNGTFEMPVRPILRSYFSHLINFYQPVTQWLVMIFDIMTKIECVEALSELPHLNLPAHLSSKMQLISDWSLENEIREAFNKTPENKPLFLKKVSDILFRDNQKKGLSENYIRRKNQMTELFGLTPLDAKVFELLACCQVNTCFNSLIEKYAPHDRAYFIGIALEESAEDIATVISRNGKLMKKGFLTPAGSAGIALCETFTNFLVGISGDTFRCDGFDLQTELSAPMDSYSLAEEDKTRIQKLFDDPKQKHLLIFGCSGVGKTVLAKFTIQSYSKLQPLFLKTAPVCLNSQSFTSLPGQYSWGVFEGHRLVQYSDFDELVRRTYLHAALATDPEKFVLVIDHADGLLKSAGIDSGGLCDLMDRMQHKTIWICSDTKGINPKITQRFNSSIELKAQ